MYVILEVIILAGLFLSSPLRESIRLVHTENQDEDTFNVGFHRQNVIL